MSIYILLLSDSATAPQTDATLPHQTALWLLSSSSSPSSSPSPPPPPPSSRRKQQPSKTSVLTFSQWSGHVLCSQYTWCVIFWRTWKSWFALFWSICAIFCHFPSSPCGWWLARRHGSRIGRCPNSNPRLQPHQLALSDRVESIKKFKFVFSADDDGGGGEEGSQNKWVVHCNLQYLCVEAAEITILYPSAFIFLTFDHFLSSFCLTPGSLLLFIWIIGTRAQDALALIGYPLQVFLVKTFHGWVWVCTMTLGNWNGPSISVNCSGRV